jgi:hypothetical protein
MKTNTTGWVCLHRKFLEKGYFSKSQYVHLWVYLLLIANHKDKEFMWNGEIKLIKSGQILTGRKSLSIETGISETTIERILNLFEKEQQIGQQKTTKYRLITILNWKEYQQTDNKRTTNGQQTDTNNNDNNDNNIGEEKPTLKKEESLSYLENLSSEEISFFVEKYNCTKEQVEKKALGITLYCQSKKKRYNNYKATLQSWLLKDFGKKETNYLKFKK